MQKDKFVEEYQKIKPTAELKNRIFYSINEVEAKRETKPFYLRMRPALSCALACVLLICCFTVIPFEPLEEGNVSVFYAQTGEFLTPSSVMSRSYGIAACDNTYYEYITLPDGGRGAEFTFEFEGKTRLEANVGELYLKNSYGSYEALGNKTRIEGNVTLLWKIPTDTDGTECVMNIKNRSFEMLLTLEAVDGSYKANLTLAE